MKIDNVKPTQVGAVLKQAAEQREINRLVDGATDEEIAANVSSMRI